MLNMGPVQRIYLKIGILLLCEVSAVHLTAIEHALGHLSVLAPTFIGRNVTFQLKPTSLLTFEQYDACKWKAIFKDQSKVHIINSGYRLFESDGIKMMELGSDYVNSSLDRAMIHVTCSDITSNYINLKLEDLKNECGHLQVLSYPEEPGDKGQIAYFPTGNILRNTLGYVRIWKKDGVDITSLDGVFEERTETLNFKYILTVLNFTGSHRYSFRCKERNTETNAITLLEGRPVLSPVCSVDNCSNCLCVRPGDRLSCISYSTNVSLWIGYNKLQLQRTLNDSLFTYTTMNVTIIAEYHQSIVVCSASYDNKEVFNASASVYVYVPPKLTPELILPELQEGYPVNITCLTTSGRPPPVIQMFLDGQKLTDIAQHNVYEAATRTYTSVATLKSAKRTWNNKNITCRYLVTYPDGIYDSGHSTTKTVNYKYPPSRLLILPTQTHERLSAWYQLDIRCQLVDSNTRCKFKWTTEEDNIQILDVQTSNMTYEESVLHVNVSANSSGHRVTCHAECDDFSLQLKEDYILDLPSAAKIMTFVVTTCGLLTEVCLTCSVKSNPLSNITLGKLNDHTNRNLCLNSIECTIYISRTDIETALNYTCQAWNIYGHSNMTLGMNKESEVSPEDHMPSTEGSIPLMSIMVGLVILAVIISTVIVFFFIRGQRRRSRRSDILNPLKEVRVNSSQQGDVLMESEHRSGNDRVNASNTEANTTVDADINIYSNVISSISRAVAQAAAQNELVYADIDLAFLEMKQKKVTKKNNYVPTEYTSVRELTADAPDEHVYVNT